MAKLLQNRVAESRLLLPIMGGYAIVVWLASGLLGGELWPQFACFVAAAYLMVELNTANALIRIYSRLVSCSFIAMMCMACGEFGSLGGCWTGLCVVGALSALLRCYQNRNAAGWVFYAFMAIGLGSLTSVWLLYYVPVVWLLMAFLLSAMSWRTLFASIIGVITPYWFASVYVVYSGDIGMAANHFAELANYGAIADFSALTANQAAVALFVAGLAVAGAVHFMRTSFKDKIRTRMFYYCFVAVSFATMALLVVQPQRYDLAIRVLIVNASPLAGHFFALTHTRFTNIAFVAVVVVMVALTLANLWMPLSISL